MKFYVFSAILLVAISFGPSSKAATEGTPYAIPPATSWGYNLWNGGTNDMYFDFRGNKTYFRAGTAGERADTRGLVVFDNSNGNAGFGNSYPAYRVESNGFVYSRSTNGFGTLTGPMTRLGLENSIRHWTISNYGSSYPPNGAFAIADETAGLVRLMIDTTGRVGIGTTNMKPITAGTTSVSINGTLYAREIQVLPSTSWPDYVFNANYKLPKLSEVEKHINEHKHLPGIPSAEEVEKNGIGLAEMSKKQMEKIEELTLYVIEMKKENEALKKRVETLENLSNIN